MREILAHEIEYWKIREELDLFSLVLPANLQEEKQKFLDAVRGGQRYDPVFRYDTLPFDADDTLRRLDAVIEAFGHVEHPIAKRYVETITDDMDRIRHFQERDKKRFRHVAYGIARCAG